MPETYSSRLWKEMTIKYFNNMFFVITFSIPTVNNEIQPT